MLIYLHLNDPATQGNNESVIFGGTARHFNLRINRKLDAGDAGFLPVPLKICDSPNAGANCRERRLQVLVDDPAAGRRRVVSAGALGAVLLVIILGLRELLFCGRVNVRDLALSFLSLPSFHVLFIAPPWARPNIIRRIFSPSHLILLYWELNEQLT